MRGALLRSGKSQTFTALGETGQPVYRAALQLRDAIRRKNPTLVDHLAILLIARRLADQASSAADALRAERRRAHGRISRGAARRVFRGERFEPA